MTVQLIVEAILAERPTSCPWILIYDSITFSKIFALESITGQSRPCHILDQGQPRIILLQIQVNVKMSTNLAASKQLNPRVIVVKRG